MKTLILSLTLACCANFAVSQILIDQSVQLNEIPNMFLGDDYEISNITFSGDLTQIGIFFGNQSNLGIDLGLTMGTGNVNLATSASFSDPLIQGPGGNNNSSGSLGGGLFGVSDEDLVNISGGLTFSDAAVLEFDFVAPEANMSFEYVFASEEYPEYTCTNFNDAFGFFLSGPGIDGEFSNNSVNVATIPNTDPEVYVTIDNINDNECGQEYVEYYVDNSEMNPDPNVIEYDGFTTILPMNIEVIPGETYHLKMAIGDASDSAFDSAVFIRSSTSAFVWAETEGSADSGGMTVLNDSQIMEGCYNGEFDVYLSYAASSAITDFSISGTATMGEDFEDVSSMLVIPENFVGIYTLPITLIEDTELEGEETIIISLSYLDEFGVEITITEELIVLDKESIEVTVEPSYRFCAADTEIEVNATATAGVEPISYEWSNGSDSALQLFTPADAGVQTVDITDNCGNTSSHQITLEIAEPLELIENVILCTEEYSSDIVVTGSAPYTFVYNEELVTQEEQTFGSSDAGTYIVSVSDQCGEAAEIEITVEICSSIEEQIESNFTLINLGSELVINTTESREALVVSIYDINGKLISQSSRLNTDNRIDISSLSSGLYILEIADEEKVVFSEKLVK